MKIPQIKDSRETVKKIKSKNFHIQITEKNHTPVRTEQQESALSTGSLSINNKECMLMLTSDHSIAITRVLEQLLGSLH